MCRYVDHISLSSAQKKEKERYPGHPEIELALVRLYRVTGEKRYLKLSKFFIDQRGQKHIISILKQGQEDSWITVIISVIIHMNMYNHISRSESK